MELSQNESWFLDVLSNVDLLQCITSAQQGNGRLFHDVTCGAWASKFGHLSLIKARTGQMRFSSWAMDEAATYGHLNLVQWFHENKLVHCTTNAMNGAAKNGHFDIVKYLHKNRNEGCTSDAMDDAARNGHFDIVQWLHCERKANCTPRAFELAVVGGHLDIAKWLHANGRAGLWFMDERAIEIASARGHINVVVWLITTITKPSWVRISLFSAACAGQLNVVKWVCGHAKEECTKEAINGAARCGHLNVVQWLCENKSDTCLIKGCQAAEDLQYAAANGHLPIVKWLYEHTKTTPARSALMMAAKGGHLDTVKWIVENTHVNRGDRKHSYNLELEDDIVAAIQSAQEGLEEIRMQIIRPSTHEGMDKERILAVHHWLSRTLSAA